MPYFNQKLIPLTCCSFVFVTLNFLNDSDISDIIIDGTEINLEVTPIIITKGACIGVHFQSSSGTSVTRLFDSPVPDEYFFVLVDCKQLLALG